MVKKEFTQPFAKAFNERSDVELIEDLGGVTLGNHERDVIKAILDKRMKIVMQDSSRISEKYSRRLIWLTWAIATLTVLLVLGLGLQIWIE